MGCGDQFLQIALTLWVTFLISYLLYTTREGNGQSTSTHLNRYTKEDQCVYSFVVPKKDRDQCPGLNSTVESLSDKLKDMERRQFEMSAVIGTLQENKRSWQQIDELEEKVRQFEIERTKLIALNDRMKAEKDQVQTKNQQLTIDLENTRSQLQALQGKYIPLEGNYTKLFDDFTRALEKLERLQFDNSKLENNIRILKMEKNCTSICKHLPSCAAIKRMGYTKSEYSMIDPDGEGGIDPFLVYCDMETDKSTGITIVEHTHAPNTAAVGCEKPGCLSQYIDYKGISMEQISKLIDISLACEQFIRYDCYDSKLLKDGTGWWVSRQGRKMRYWGGAGPTSNMCACGVTGSCIDKNEVCNCDADFEEWLYDAGFIRDKAVLPVRQLNFGDVSKENGEKGKSTLGFLQCKWDVGYPVPSCEALKDAGVIQSGDYMIIQDNSEDLTRMRCNLNVPAIAPNGAVPVIPLSSKNVTNQLPSASVTAFEPNANKNQYMFTDCGKPFGRFGPTEAMCHQTYRRTNVQVRVKDGIQFWVVPRNGRYNIEARGPAGQQYIQQNSGRGATVSGEFILEKGTTIKVLVGQKGTRHANKAYYGGSGGTFVVKYVEWVNHPLVVAGGGGCSATKTAIANLQHTDASSSRHGKDASEVGTNYGHGGKYGYGGERGGTYIGRNTGRNTGGGGSGFLYDGIESGDKRWGTVEPAKAFCSYGTGIEAPGVGGRFSDSYGKEFNGGFGGGGSAALYASGGAGGYSGGGGGPDKGYSGGAGSFADAQKGRSIDIGVNNSGAGLVKIEYLGPSPQLDKNL